MDATLNIAIAAEFELSEKIVDLLEQSAVNISKVSAIEIFPFEEEQYLRFKKSSVPQIALENVDWSSFHYVFFAGNIEQASHIAAAADAGCVVIDLFAICGILPDVPVVVPGINDTNLIELRQRNIVSLANPQVSQISLALTPILQQTELSQIFVTSLLPASYLHAENVTKLANQTARLLNGIPLEKTERRLAFDVFPKETSHLTLQLQKIYPQLNDIVFHQIQVPVFYGMAQKVTVFAKGLIESVMENSSLIQWHETMITPVLNSENESGDDAVKLHITQPKILESENGQVLEFWSVADEQRFHIAQLGTKLFESLYFQGY